jgi:hypothetical protein
MKRIRILITLILISTVTMAQNPPDPDPNPNNGGQDLGGNAPVGSGLLILTLLGGAYGAGKTLLLNCKKNKDLPTE